MIEDYNTPGIDDKEKTTEAGIRTISRTNSPSSSHARWTQPFIAAHDIPRGAVYALQVLLGYTLMLAIMYALLICLFVGCWTHYFVICRTFQAAYLISIIIGSGLGEVLFGKIGGARHVH
jgi:copper transporter 1